MDFTQTHFALFGLPQAYAIDRKQLDAAYRELGINPNPLETTYFLSRETIVRATTGFSLNAVQEKLFEVLNRNSLSATAYFNLPPGRVVELGMQVEL